jgi:hypothetical protein
MGLGPAPPPAAGFHGDAVRAPSPASGAGRRPVSAPIWIVANTDIGVFTDIG